MIANINPILAAALFGIILIFVRYWRTIHALLIKKHLIRLRHLVRFSRTIYALLIKRHLIRQKHKPGPVGPSIVATNSQLFDRIIEYLLTITVTFISFYSAYTLSIKKTVDDQKKASIELLEQAELRCTSLEGVLKSYTTNTLNSKASTPSDSEVVTNYCNNSIVQPLYITDVITPEKILSYLSPRGFEVLSGLEESQRVAHNNIVDTTLSFLQRHISFIAFMRFEYLRDSLIQAERKYIQGSIKQNQLELIQDYINKKNSTLANAVNPYVYSRLVLDTSVKRSDFQSEEPETDIGSASEIDSLWRYSYLMIGIYGHKYNITANCFFLRESGQLYLVATYGIMTSWSPWDTSRFGIRQKDFPDTFNLRLYSKSTHACTYIPIDISKIKSESKRLRGYSEPDVYFYKITDASIENRYEINTIDSFLAINRSKYQRPNEVIVVGSPMSEFKSRRDFDQLPAEIYPSKIIGLYELNLYYPGVRNADSINYKIYSSLDNTYWGSAIFFKELIPDVDRFKQILIFGGIYTGHDVNNASGMAIRPEQIIRRLAELK